MHGPGQKPIQTGHVKKPVYPQSSRGYLIKGPSSLCALQGKEWEAPCMSQ